MGIHRRRADAGAPQGSPRVRVCETVPTQLQVDDHVLSESIMKIKLNVWRQHDKDDKGRFVGYAADGIAPDMSFLEMLDLVNLGLAGKGEDTIAFDHDCREGICGSCGMYINGRAHG